jgi:hypothetical protein
MKTVGLRTYSISPHEFPITILVTASGLPVNRAVIGQPRVTLDGVLIERLVPEVDEDLAAGTLRYQIDLPPIPPAPFDLTQTIDCWFTADASPDARYQFVISAKSGDNFPTTVRVPSINPGRANLAFRVE